jgi:uncharacterized protein YdbL (DUF1318 family)
MNKIDNIKLALVKAELFKGCFYNIWQSLKELRDYIQEAKNDGSFDDKNGYLVRTETLADTLEILHNQVMCDRDALYKEICNLRNKENNPDIKFVVGKRYTATTRGEYVVTARYGNGRDIYIVCNNNIVFKIMGKKDGVEVAENEYTSCLRADNKYATDEQEGYVNV